MKRILAALGIGAATMAAADDGYYGKYETPRYEVVAEYGAAELRSYAPHLLAVVAVRGDRRGALNQGFRTLAGYIFGGNAGGASVAMTSPVTQAPAQIDRAAPVTQIGEDGVWEVTFMMPSDFTRDTLPAPNNDAVRFVEVPARQMLVATFSGRSTDRILTAQTDALRRLADEAGIGLTGAPTFMFYDDPFTLPGNRRNEVGFEVRSGT
ncbi:SOUL family heme-binding protein [Pseudooctadecabacter sp.]|uniref:SOUL family heme-binding protein n=1 Tax=Pseudooctadecabacter sp. TaxID=1966338 RepID=UPI0026006F28|nr:heme-binding protein [Pseudooctadecabacter sp.]